MSSSAKIDYRKKDILVLGKGPTQGLEHSLSVEKLHSIDFTGKNNTSCLSMHCNEENCYLFVNEENCYLFVNGTQIIKLKAKDPEILPHPLCLGNISRLVSR